jgi:cell division protein FtsA
VGPRKYCENISLFFKECNIRLTHIIAGCFADALFCFDEDERNLGITLINIGAHYTTASFFVRGRLHDQVTVPMGGQDITEDIARVYGIKVTYAEEIKTSFGSALINLEHYHKSIPISFSEEKKQADFSIPYTSLVDVIQSRCEKILSRLKEGMRQSPHFQSTSTLYLTGGGSHLVGIEELFQRSFGRTVRVVAPLFAQKVRHRSNAMTSAVGGLFYQDTILGAHLMPKKSSVMEKINKIIKPFFSRIKKLC